MIRVVYRTGEEELIPLKFLDILLYLDQVQMFERTNGWVVVGVDKLRSSNLGIYSGIDQRQHQPTPLPDPIMTDHWPHHSQYHPADSDPFEIT